MPRETARACLILTDVVATRMVDDLQGTPQY